jgi:hypothetical protein
MAQSPAALPFRSLEIGGYNKQFRAYGSERLPGKRKTGFYGGAGVKSLALSLCVLGTQLLAAASEPIQRGDDHAATPAEGHVTDPLRWANSVSADTRVKILALDPERVTESDIRTLLSRMPAPQIIKIHGGLLPVKLHMKSFTKFLVGMGYPEASVRNPTNGMYTYGYYHSSDLIAGVIAWYYERDGLRPMVVGHSLGGFQAIRVLHKLAGESGNELSVWNPLTGRKENRCVITDPLDGTTRPVVGLQVSYATAIVAGGLGRILPNEWDMNNKLRKIPDSVEEFTGFQKGLDLLGGDFLGSGPSNDYHAMGKAKVHNVRLEALSPHGTIPDTSSLVKDPRIKDWINNYQPGDQGLEAVPPEHRFGLKSARIIWAAEVWHNVKKHWVIELQRLIQAKAPQDHVH